MSRLGRNSLVYHVLMGLLPYTGQNLSLAFKPNKFFNDLEKLSKKNVHSVRNAYYRSQRQGLVTVDASGIPHLTDKGYAQIRPYEAKVLPGGAQLMIIFDIPEAERRKRNHLRRLLQELSFVQVQKSVWVSPLDYREIIKQEINENELGAYVVVYEVAPIRLK
jgi:DNA-binding transcriptional regulator PaaX